MFCAKCQNDLVDCTCPDIEDRLEQLRKSKYIDSRMIDHIVDARQLKKDQTKGQNEKE